MGDNFYKIFRYCDQTRTYSLEHESKLSRLCIDNMHLMLTFQNQDTTENSEIPYSIDEFKSPDWVLFGAHQIKLQKSMLVQFNEKLTTN